MNPGITLPAGVGDSSVKGHNGNRLTQFFHQFQIFAVDKALKVPVRLRCPRAGTRRSNYAAFPSGAGSPRRI